MSRVDVLQLRDRGVRSSSGTVVAVLTGGSPQVTVSDADDEPMFRVDKQILANWFARTPDGEALLRIDWSLGTTHTLTFADGRTGRFDATPNFGEWELRDGRDGRLLVHCRSIGALPRSFEWECAQDGTLTLLDFVAAVVTYRELRKARRRHVEGLEGLS